jgi:hypothetical protein
MAKPAQGFPLNLPDSLTGEPKFLTHFFQRVGSAIVQAKAEPKDPCLTG